jgi:hypothetical protein
MPKERILLVHLAANGDCLMATTVARQIKEDFPGSHLTWAIGYKSRHVIDNNPHVDEIWSVDYLPDETPYHNVWRRTKEEAERRKAAGDFDHVFYTQIFPDNLNNFDGTTRSSTFRSYPGTITVPVAPIIRLRDHEVERVRLFAASNDLQRYENVVIFECAPGSQQSPLTPDLALGVVRRIVEQRSDTAFIISSHHRFNSDHPAIIDGSVLSYRENAELSKYGTLLLGGSSGITWLMTSEWSKRLPTIQFLQKNNAWYCFASVKYDHRFFGLDASHILETDLSTKDDIADLISKYLTQKTFEGFTQSVFRPSVDQLNVLYDAVQGQIEIGRVLRNFIARNPEVKVDIAAFYGGLARRVLRVKNAGLKNRVKGIVRRIYEGRARKG